MSSIEGHPEDIVSFMLVPAQSTLRSPAGEMSSALDELVKKEDENVIEVKSGLISLDRYKN